MRRSVTDCRRGMANFASTIEVGADGRPRRRRGVSVARSGSRVGDPGGGHVLAGGARIAAEPVRRAASLTGHPFAVDRRSRRLPRRALLGCRSPRGSFPPAGRMRLAATRPRVGVARRTLIETPVDSSSSSCRAHDLRRLHAECGVRPARYAGSRTRVDARRLVRAQTSQPRSPAALMPEGRDS